MVYSTCDSLIPHKIIGLNVLNEVSCSLSSASLIASSNNRYLPRFDCFLALTLCCRNWHLTLRTMECRLPLRHQPQRLSWKKLQTFFTNGVHPWTCWLYQPEAFWHVRLQTTNHWYVLGMCHVFLCQMKTVSKTLLFTRGSRPSSKNTDTCSVSPASACPRNRLLQTSAWIISRSRGASLLRWVNWFAFGRFFLEESRQVSAVPN